jgi:hypothetical protein
MRACAAVLGLAVAVVGIAGACDDTRKPSERLVVIEATKSDGSRPTTRELELSERAIRVRLDKLGFPKAGVIRRGREIAFRLPAQVEPRVLPLLIRVGRLELFDLQGDLAPRSLDAQGNPRPSVSPLQPRAKTEVVTCTKKARYCPGVSGVPTQTYYYLFRYDPKSKTRPIPEMSGADLELKGTRQDFDSSTNAPIVLMQFTPSGSRKFKRVTQRLAERGRALYNQRGGNYQNYLQQFAIVLDSEMRSAPTIDFKENPSGIPGRNGAQITGIGSFREVQDLAFVIQTGSVFPLEFRVIKK